jgi:hypothetical protein
VKSLSKGHPGTFEGNRKDYIPDWVIIATLPFMPPTVQAMVQIQGMLAMRSEEVCNITVGSIDRSKGNGLWYYVPPHHKTEEHIGKKILPLGKPEQELLAPYLIDKKPENAVFSPRTAQQERRDENRAKRKTKLTPSQIARDAANAKKPSKYKEFYNKDSYRNALQSAIAKGRKNGVDIPHWFPKLLRNFGVTYIEETEATDGLDCFKNGKHFALSRLQIRSLIS